MAQKMRSNLPAVELIQPDNEAGPLYKGAPRYGKELRRKGSDNDYEQILRPNVFLSTGKGQEHHFFKYWSEFFLPFFLFSGFWGLVKRTGSG